MKKCIILLMLMCSVSFYAQDVIVLKDGTTILSKVTEVSSSEVKYLKFTHLDGPVITIKVSDILSINYENGEKESFNKQKHDNTETKKQAKANFIKIGYCALFDLGHTEGFGKYGEKRIDFTTSHGFRPKDFLFLGGGAGVSYWYDNKSLSIPIFVNLRCDIPFSFRINPFVDAKIGYSPIDMVGLYSNYSFGFRFCITKKLAANISAGYQIQKCKVTDESLLHYKDYINYDYDPWIENEIRERGKRRGYSIKVGLEF